MSRYIIVDATSKHWSTLDANFSGSQGIDKDELIADRDRFLKYSHSLDDIFVSMSLWMTRYHDFKNNWHETNKVYSAARVLKFYELPQEVCKLAWREEICLKEYEISEPDMIKRVFQSRLSAIIKEAMSLEERTEREPVPVTIYQFIETKMFRPNKEYWCYKTDVIRDTSEYKGTAKIRCIELPTNINDGDSARAYIEKLIGLPYKMPTLDK